LGISKIPFIYQTSKMYLVKFQSANVKNEIELHELSIKIQRLKKMRDEFLNIEDEFTLV